jgi:hypothetical protein
MLAPRHRGPGNIPAGPFTESAHLKSAPAENAITAHLSEHADEMPGYFGGGIGLAQAKPSRIQRWPRIVAVRFVIPVVRGTSNRKVRPVKRLTAIRFPYGRPAEPPAIS